MESALIVSSSPKTSELFISLLRDSTERQTIAKNGGEARRLLIENDFDLVVISAPLSDEFGHELALNITDDSHIGVVLIVKSEMLEEISSVVESNGVIVLPNPLNKQLFFLSIKMLCSVQNRIRNILKEKAKLEEKIKDIRLIDRAKCALIQYLALTEPEAHRYIEKQAMDRRLSRTEIAVEILKAYEN